MAINESVVETSRIITQFSDNLTMNIIVAGAIIILGIVLGRLIFYALKKLSIKIELKNSMSESFIRLLLTIIEWSIFIIFIDFALKQLNVPLLTNAITRIIIVIPAITSALILIAIGMGIAFYLRGIIEDSEITGWKTISMYFFYFILYIFGVYSLKIALVSMDSLIVDIIIIVLTLIQMIIHNIYLL